jgi:hypothetical protein
MLCAETSRLAACDTVSLHAPGADKHSPVAGQRKALKRSVYAEDNARAAGFRAARHRAILRPGERRFDTAFQARSS